MASRIPGPICGSTLGPQWIDKGTSCLWRTGSPALDSASSHAPAQVSNPDEFFYSPAVKVAVDVPFSVAPGLTWDAFWRLIYDHANAGLQRQANLLLEQGRVTVAESRKLVEARNELLLRVRSRLSPFGELYSELLKPRAGLKSFEQFLAEKGTVEAVLRSVGKTRAVVDRIAVASRVAGPAAIVLDVSLTAIVIQRAAPADRGRVTAREVGGLAGSVGGGFAGMWAGCASAALLASPSLTLPVIGEVTTGGACLVGGMLGGLGVGWLGREAGHWAGQGLYDLVNEVGEFHWSGGR